MGDNIQSELRDLFEEHGITPEEISAKGNDNQWQVSVQVEGTDDRFIEGYSGVGNDEPMGYNVDGDALDRIKPRIDGASIPSGTVKLLPDGISEGFRLRIE